MSLVYTDPSSVEIKRDAGFRIATVNAAVRKLIENDLSFFGVNVQPGVWERRWYNDAENKDLYYKRGDTVWVNTEPADEFVAAHLADIDMYVQGCADARYKYMSLSATGDTAGIYRLYRDMALGLGDFNVGIYYLGNLLDPVQIRVSLSDDNNQPPTNDRYWTDFFDRSYDKEFYRKQILSAIDVQLSRQYDQHLINYHLSGLEDPDEFYERYLQSDLTNISKQQKFINHSWYQPDMTGFDHVVLFCMRNLGNQQRQWFRIWKSGFLEHGGMVKVSGSSSDCGTNNASAKLYTVNLGWSYNGKSAPVYDFQTAGIGGFYSHDNQIYTGSGSAVDYRVNSDALGRVYRYVVDVSPVQSTGAAASGGPYQPVHCDRFMRYPGKEVTNMNNGSFTFHYAPGMQMYSYYVKGFTVNKVRYY